MESNHSRLELLEFYVATGADEAMGEELRDRTVVLKNTALETPPLVPFPAPTPPLTRAISTHAEPLPPPPAGTFEALGSARDAARAAKTLDALRAALESFEGLSLKRTATQMVFADGVPTARIMLVGEAPADDEDRMGKPFAGQNGRLLDRMLAAIGLSRESNVYISNVINWRPPGNRSPSDAEIALSLPFIQRHIELINPAVLITVGGVSAKALLQSNLGITRLRGKWLDYTSEGLEKPMPSMAIFHPAYLLRLPSQKALAWQDLLKIRERLRELGL